MFDNKQEIKDFIGEENFDYGEDLFNKGMIFFYNRSSYMLKAFVLDEEVHDVEVDINVETGKLKTGCDCLKAKTGTGCYHMVAICLASKGIIEETYKPSQDMIDFVCVVKQMKKDLKKMNKSDLINIMIKNFSMDYSIGLETIEDTMAKM